MRCSGCGKWVAYRGVACRHCGFDKARDKKKLLVAVSSMVAGGLIGAGVDGVLGIFVGMFLGGALGTLVGLVRYGGEMYLPEAGVADGASVSNVMETASGAEFGAAIHEVEAHTERKGL
jgi:hypothetical protein